MNARLHRVFAAAAVLLLPTGCASIHPDHFYTLQAVPRNAAEARDRFAAEVALEVTLPSLNGRDQFVLMRGKDVVILEHERWASPLSEQMTTVIGQNIEQRRPELLVMTQPRAQARGMPRFVVRVEVVTLALRQNGGDSGRGLVELEARWQIHLGASAGDRSGRGAFTASAIAGTPSALTQALSECLAGLSDQITKQLTPSADQP